MPISHHNPALYAKLQALLAADDAQSLGQCLASLSHAAQRTAGYMLATQLLPTVSQEVYRNAFLTLVPSCPKAYLVTFLKAALSRYKVGNLQFTDSLFEVYAHSGLSSIDCNKVLTNLLPICKRPEEITHLLRLFAPEGVRLRMAHLLRCSSVVAAYALFQEAQSADAEQTLLREVYAALLRRGDGLGRKLASLMQVYFSLEPLSLASPIIQPYQLSQLEGGYEVFLKVMGE